MPEELPLESGAGRGVGWQGQMGVGGNAGIGAYGEGTAWNVPAVYTLTGRQSPVSGQNPAPLGKRVVGSAYGLRAADPAPPFWERGWRRWVPWLRGVYVLGTTVLLVYFAMLYLCWKRRLSYAVRQRENIWYSEQVSSPFVLGVLHPRIFLPYGLCAREERYILLHEQTHIRHRDPLLRLLGTFALCLHWWNPLVWLGIHCFYQDMEMFCDEAAMEGAKLPERRAYAETLLNFAIGQHGPGMALAFGETHTEQRVRNILRPKRRGSLTTLAVVLAAMLGGMIFLTVPQGSGDLTGQGKVSVGEQSGQNGLMAGELSGQSDLATGELSGQSSLVTGKLNGQSDLAAGELNGQSGLTTGERNGQGVFGAGTGQSENAENSRKPSDREVEKLQNLVLSQTRFSLAEGQNITLELVLMEGVYYTREQMPESLFAENYEGCYQLRTLDTQGQVLHAAELANGQGGAVMNFPCRDFPWYFEDYNLDGRQDFFLGTKDTDGRSYYYLMTVTDQGEFTYLYDGPMWEGYWPLEAENITDIKLESGGGEHDFRTFLLYQMNQEYSSHDFYTWSPYFEQYRKSVAFIDVYPEGQDLEALNYLEGSWRISGVDMWDQNQPRPSNRIGEVLHYESDGFQQMDLAGNVIHEHAIEGASSLLQSKEEFWNTYNMLFPSDNEEPIKRILVNLGYQEDGCRLGNAVFVVSENEMLVCDLEEPSTFWTATREELRGEAGEIGEYLQGTWEITDILNPYGTLEQEEAEVFLGTRLTYDWQNTANEYAIEGAWNYSMPIQGFAQRMDNSDNLPPELELPEGEMRWYYVNLGEGELYGDAMIPVDESRMWICYMDTFFKAKRTE